MLWCHTIEQQCGSHADYKMLETVLHLLFSSSTITAFHPVYSHQSALSKTHYEWPSSAHCGLRSPALHYLEHTVGNFYPENSRAFCPCLWPPLFSCPVSAFFLTCPTPYSQPSHKALYTEHSSFCSTYRLFNHILGDLWSPQTHLLAFVM